MRLFALIYSSKRKSTCNQVEIDKILASCEKNNPSKDITGVLLHSDSNFIQYLEGNMKDITELYDLIKLDDRHERVVMISLGPIKERNFPNWHMGYKEVDSNDLAFNTNISANEKLIFKSLINGEKQSDSRAVSLLTKFYDRV